MAFAWLCGKPLYMYPQSIGPIVRGWERSLLRWLLPKFRIFLLRDPTSLALVDSLHLQKKSYRLTPDLAFLYEGAAKERGLELLERYGVSIGRPTLGVTLLDWGKQYPVFVHQERYEQEVANAIRHFVETYDGQAVLFSQVCGPTVADDDRLPARRVLDQLASWGVNQHVYFVDEEAPPDVLQAAYGCMDLFLGSRLHSNIFALIRHVPVLAIAYQDKTIGVLHMLGLDEWAIPIEDVTDGSLPPRLDALWQHRKEVGQQVVAGVSRLRREATVALDLIAADYVDLSRDSG